MRAPVPLPRSARPGYNPLPDFFGSPQFRDFASNALIDLGYGLTRSADPWQALGVAVQRTAEMQPERDAYATAKKEEAERQRQLNQTIQFLRSQHPDLAGMVEAGMPINEAWGEALKRTTPSGADMPSNVREWEYFNALAPEEQAAYLRMKRANPYLDIGTGFVQPDPTNPGAVAGPVIPKHGNVPTGYQQTGDGEIAPMPGSEPDVERQGQRVKAVTALTTLEQKNQIAVGAIDTALRQADGWTTGMVGGLTNAIPGTPAYDLAKTLETIKANIGFEELQTMRENSPTGGALGQVTERELAFLQSTIANIEQPQSEEQLKRNLKTLRDFIAASQERRRAAYQQQYGGTQGPAPTGDDIDSILGGYGL